MATQSGCIYKITDQEKIDSAVMEETLKSVEKMIQQLLEDQRKLEGKLALELAAREEGASQMRGGVCSRACCL